MPTESARGEGVWVIIFVLSMLLLVFDYVFYARKAFFCDVRFCWWCAITVGRDQLPQKVSKKHSLLRGCQAPPADRSCLERCWIRGFSRKIDPSTPGADWTPVWGPETRFFVVQSGRFGRILLLLFLGRGLLLSETTKRGEGWGLWQRLLWDVGGRGVHTVSRLCCVTLSTSCYFGASSFGRSEMGTLKTCNFWIMSCLVWKKCHQSRVSSRFVFRCVRSRKISVVF